jgi:ferredoxin-type protein NapF
MQQVAVHRRQFLRGDLRGRRVAVRPPWALAEAAFVERCTRCDDCAKACPEQLIRRGSGGYPEVDFGARGCSFCGDCVTVCKAAAFADPVGSPLEAWRQRAAVAPNCLAVNGVVCRACGDHCAVGAIRFRLAPGGRSHPGVDLSRCNGCGACIAVCPVRAISLQVPVSSEVAA